MAIDLLKKCADKRSHKDWARSVARGIRRYVGFLAASQEEAELEAVAYFTLVRKAPHFQFDQVPPGGDADMAFRGWIHPSIRAECLREAKRLKTGGTYWSPSQPDAAKVRCEGLPYRRDADGIDEVEIEDYRGEGEPQSDVAELSALLLDLAALSPSEEFVVRSLFGLGTRQRTDLELSHILGVGRDVIRSIEVAACQKLRQAAGVDTLQPELTASGTVPCLSGSAT